MQNGRLSRNSSFLAQLDHPRIVTIHDVVEQTGRLFIVMRLVDGTSLDKRLANGGLPGVEMAVEQGHNDPNREAFPAYFMSFRLVAGKVTPAQGDPNRAVEIAGNLLADLHQTGIRLHIPGALLLQGQPLLALGRPEAAQTSLREARSEAEAIGSR